MKKNENMLMGHTYTYHIMRNSIINALHHEGYTHNSRSRSLEMMTVQILSEHIFHMLHERGSVLHNTDVDIMRPRVAR